MAIYVCMYVYIYIYAKCMLVNQNFRPHLVPHVFFFRSISCAMRQDVCFFHPFDDCNSRMARLVLDFLLTREGETMVAGAAWG